MTLNELKEVIDELLDNGTDGNTEICISHYFDHIKLVEGIEDIGSDIRRRREVITIEGNGEDITLIN